MSLTSVRLRQAWNWGGLSAKRLAVLTYQAMDRHETLDRAAVVAFYAIFSIVPFLGLVFAIALGTVQGLGSQMVDFTSRMVPDAAETIVREQIDKIQKSPPTGILSVSFVVLLWTSSSMFVAVMDAMNAAQGVRDARPWWKRRVRAVLLTLIESVLLLGASILIIAWPHLLAFLSLSSFAAQAATVVQWLVVLIALFVGFSVAYFFGPDVEQEWEWITPGAALGVLVLIAVSIGFRLYLQYGSGSSGAYGAMAGVVALLLWLYLAALALLVGAELNAVIERAAPQGSRPGKRVQET